MNSIETFKAALTAVNVEDLISPPECIRQLELPALEEGRSVLDALIVEAATDVRDAQTRLQWLLAVEDALLETGEKAASKKS